jgi:hypothetical protein
MKKLLHIKKLEYIFILIILSISCTTKDNRLYEIDPRTFIQNKIKLSDIADDIKYIPLDNSIPFVNFKYVLTSNYFYVAAKGIGILKFDRQGRLINKIGSPGRGPGEFTYGFNFAVDESTGNVFVRDHADLIKVYSKNGTFLREISLNNKTGDRIGWDGDIELFNSMLFFPNSLGSGNSKYAWAFLDTLGNVVALKENSVPTFQTNNGREAELYKFEDNLFYFNYFNDTIFKIFPDLRYEPKYLYAKGDHRWPKTGITTRSLNETNAQIYKTFDPGTVFETKRFLVLQYSYLDIGATCFIDKKTKETFLPIKLDESPTQYIRLRKYKSDINNDLDGGMTLSKFNYYFENDVEYFITLINPSNLKYYTSSNDFIDTTPKYPEKKKELERLANSINDTDNPILVIVKLIK